MVTSILTSLDGVLCILVVLAALEFLRSVHLFEHPVLSVSFYMVAIGAFGLLVEIAQGRAPSPWAVLLHLGVVTCLWSHRREIFRRSWHWSGQP